MIEHDGGKLVSSVFITFPGTCKQALSFYQNCFGGKVHLETLEQEMGGFRDTPIISGSLISDSIIIHGSDLVHDEGRKLGNYIAIYLQCRNTNDRNVLINKMKSNQKKSISPKISRQKLVEFTDVFDVRWILGI